MTEFEKMELVRKVGLFGLTDLRKLAPIGNIGYANGWYGPFFWDVKEFVDCEIPKMIMKAFWEQKEKFGYTLKSWSSGWANTTHHNHCKELGLSWSVDSSD